MKNFIKENWFRLIVALFLLVCLIIGFCFISNQHSLETAMKCNNDGQKFFNSYKLSKVDYNPRFDEPTYHFNDELNTCLIEVSYQESTHDSLGKPVWDISHAEVTDIYANKVLVSTENLGNDAVYQQKRESLMSQ